MKRTIEIIVVIVVVILAVLFVFWKKTASNDLKQSALIDELRAARLGVGLYLEVNKSYPPDLKALATSKYKMGGEDKVYLTGIQLNKEGMPIDAFGNTFNYDPATGRVWPTEKEYASW